MTNPINNILNIVTMILKLFIYFTIDHFYLISFILLTLKHYALK